MPWVEKPYTFEEISDKREHGSLSFNEYLHELCLHLLPEWHEDIGVMPMLKNKLLRNDPFTFTFWYIQNRIVPIRDPKDIERVFHAYKEDGIIGVSFQLRRLPAQTQSYVCALLALWALMTRKVDLLRMTIDNPPMLEGGARFWPARAFEQIANGVEATKEGELFDVIAGSEFRRKFPWQREGYFDGMSYDQREYFPETQIKCKM